MGTLISVLLCASLFAATMKMADLLDEHGLRLFKYDAVIFGILWGFFGLLLIVENVSVGNLVLATVIGFLTRMKLDYRNHAIAASIIIIGFLFFGTFKPRVFLFFYLIFVILGSVRDVIRYGSQGAKSPLLNFSREKLSLMHYYDFSYIFPALVYSLLTNDWIVLYAACIIAFSYCAIKFIGKRCGYA